MNYKTEQENFWAGEFGDDYFTRNQSTEQIASALNFFSNCFQRIEKPNSLIEFGANVGVNLKAIKLLFPKIEISAIEINKSAAIKLSQTINLQNIFNQSILDFNSHEKYDIVVIKGVLIHINPDMLNEAYEKLYSTSNKYILIAEYYNPIPVSINYRGNQEKLFKRDFAAEIMNKYSDLKLLDYGFVYKGDLNFPQDDITWFLLKKS